MTRRTVVTHGVALLLLTGCRAALAQSAGSEGYRHLSGSVAVGWLDSTTTGLLGGSTRNPFTSLQFDYRGAVVDPAFINFRVQPVFGAGFQDLFGTAAPRSGVAAELSFLPYRPFPLRLYFGRFRRNTLAASSRAYSRVLAKNDDTLFGIQWRLLDPRWPSLDVSASDSNVTTRPEEVLLSGYGTHSRNLALTGNDVRWGWTLDGSIHLQRLDAERLGASESGPVPFDTATDLRTLRLLGQRELGRWFSLTLNVSGSFADTRVANGNSRQRHDTYSGRLLFQPAVRFTTWVEGRLSSSALEARSADVPGGSGFEVPRTDTSDRSGDWEARYEVLRGLRLFGRLEFTRVTATTPAMPSQRHTFLNSVGGVQFLRDAGWVSLSGSYTLNRFLRQTLGIAANELVGHAADASLSVGRASAVRLSVGYSWSRSRQEVRSALPYRNDSRRIHATVEKEFTRASRVQLRWDLTETSYDAELLRSDFRGYGYGAALSLWGINLAYDHGYGSGDSTQQVLDPVIVPLSGAPPVVILGSDNDYTTASASWSLTDSLSLRGVWRDQRQALATLQVSRVEQREAVIRYQFRLLRFEGGYVFYRYHFGLPESRRSLTFRVVRDFRLF